MEDDEDVDDDDDNADDGGADGGNGRDDVAAADAVTAVTVYNTICVFKGVYISMGKCRKDVNPLRDINGVTFAPNHR